MVYYNRDWHVAQALPPMCPKCGSHRTAVVGRSDDGAAVVVRCNACGSTSRVTLSGTSPFTFNPESAFEPLVHN